MSMHYNKRCLRGKEEIHFVLQREGLFPNNFQDFLPIIYRNISYFVNFILVSVTSYSNKFAYVKNLNILKTRRDIEKPRTPFRHHFKTDIFHQDHNWIDDFSSENNFRSKSFIGSTFLIKSIN